MYDPVGGEVEAEGASFAADVSDYDLVTGAKERDTLIDKRATIANKSGKSKSTVKLESRRQKSCLLRRMDNVAV